MKTKNILCGFSIAVALQLGMLAGSAQTNLYLFSGSETNITLPPGTYIITAYGAPGCAYGGIVGCFGAVMSGEFNFSTPTTLTLLVGGFGGYSGGGAGGGEWWWQTESAPGWSGVFRRFDVYSPWNVGNYYTDGQNNKYASTGYWSQDLAAATAAGMLYLPVIYPGFSWDNLM